MAFRQLNSSLKPMLKDHRPAPSKAILLSLQCLPLDHLLNAMQNTLHEAESLDVFNVELAKQKIPAWFSANNYWRFTPFFYLFKTTHSLSAGLPTWVQSQAPMHRCAWVGLGLDHTIKDSCITGQSFLPPLPTSHGVPLN